MVSHKSDSVRALCRGLAILRYVNQAGACRAGDIARNLNIPRPTVYRLLETLEEEGYVFFSPTSNRVRVTRLAASLGDRSDTNSRLCQVVGPLFAEFSQHLVWPLDLSVYENAAMVVQETTHERSPLSIDRGMTGFHLPVLRTSAGRCYLGLCPDEERAIIIDHVKQLGDPEDKAFLQAPRLNKLLSDTRKAGLGTRFDGEFRPKTASIAVPVWSAGRLIACVSIIWVRRAMRPEDALERMVAPMQELSARISQALGD